MCHISAYSQFHLHNLRRREQLLNVTEEDVKYAAHQYLAEANEKQHFSLAILGEKTEKFDNEWNIQSWGESSPTATTSSESEEVSK